MPPRLRTSTLKTASAPPVVVESTSSGRAHTLSSKQQQLDTDKALKQASAKDKAYTQALRAHQAQEAIMGYQAIPIQAPAPPSAAANADGLEPESEDDENQPAAHGQGFTSVTLQLIIKTSVCDGCLLTHHVPIDKENVSPSFKVPMGGPSKNLVRQVSSQPPQASPSIIPAAGPYSPNSVSLYGRGDSTYYTKERRHVDAEDSDDEFGTKLSGVTYPQPTEYRYPQVHPDLEAFPRSMTEAVSVKPTKAVTPATNPRIRKDCPVTPAPSTTIIIKRPKMETSGTQGCIRASDFDKLSKSLLEESISIYRTQIGGVQPYPDRLEECDAATAAWVEACTACGVHVEFDEDILKLMTARASQVRGYLKTTARPLVEAAYRINPNAPKREIRNLIEDLQTQNNFLYKDLKERKGIYCHPAFQSIINKTWFKNKSDDGVIHPKFSEGGMLSKVTKALAITVVENCLDEWQTGEHVDIPFTAAAYKPKFTTNLKQLIVFDDKTKESDIVPRLLKHMLKMARKHAKVTDAPEVAQAIQFTEDDVEAAKKEWESMVFSDDE